MTNLHFDYDIGNLIGVCVVSGNVRRSAELALGSIDDPAFLDAKNYEAQPGRAEWGWPPPGYDAATGIRICGCGRYRGLCEVFRDHRRAKRCCLALTQISPAIS